jgi:hypothetical protein
VNLKKILLENIKRTTSFTLAFFSIQKRRILLFSLLILFLFSLTFRFYGLDQTPPGLGEQEAKFGLFAIELAGEGSRQDVFIQNGFDFGIFTHLVHFSFEIFGINVFGLRFVSALFGTLTVAGFFLLLKKLHFSFALSLLGIFFLSFSFWHINLSRLASADIFIPFIIIWSFYFLLFGLSSGRYFPFVLAGSIFGAGTLFHPLLFFLFIILFLFFLLLVVLNKKIFTDLKPQLFLFLLSILIFSFPFFLQVYSNPVLFQTTVRESLNFNSADFHPIQNILVHFRSLFYLGDSLQLHNHLSTPAIPLAWSILFFFGFILSAKNIFLSVFGKFKNISIAKNIHASILAQCIFLIALLIRALNSDSNPDFRQFSWAIPAVFIFCLIPFEYLLEIYQKLKLSIRISLKSWRWNVMQISIFILFITIILAGFSQIYLYFKVWADDVKTKEAYQQKQVAFGKTISSIQRKENNFIIIPSKIDLPENKKDADFNTTIFSGFPEIKSYTFLHPKESLVQIHCENSLIIFYDSSDLLRKQFQKKCPENNFKKQTSPDGMTNFWTMRE